MKLFTKIQYNITEIKYFSTDGSSLPNGHPIQKGAFIKDCQDNSKKFKSENFQYLIINENFQIVESVHPEQYGLVDYRGGIISFSTDVNAVNFDKNQIVNFFKKVYKTLYNRFFAKK